MLQGKPLEFSDFHRFAANAVSVNTFLLGEGDLLFWQFIYVFLVANVRVKENRHGQIYDMGKPYPQVIRENVLDLHNNGLSIRQISAQARVSTGFITKVIKEYNENNYSVPRRALSGRKESVLNENVRSYLEVEKLCKPSSYCNELQRRLLLDGVSLPGEIPSNASVRRFFNKGLIGRFPFTKKNRKFWW